MPTDSMARRRVKELPSQDLLAEMFEYDDDTGVLRWKIRPPSHFRSGRYWRAWNSANAGKIAGTVSHRGYLQVYIGNTKFWVHRVVFKIIHGYDPVEVDHQDHDPSNNRRANLIDATGKQNSKNVKLRSNNTSGVTGVSWCKKREKWIVTICIAGKSTHLGSFLSKSDAASAASLAYAENSFHPNHGK